DELNAFGAYLGEALAEAPDPAIDNQVLGTHVLRSDLMATVTDFPLQDLLAQREPLVFWSAAASAEDFDAIASGWPVNYPAAPTGQDDLATPLLFMNGGLDLQTPLPWARKLASELGATLVEFPFVGHGVDISLGSPFTVHDASCSLGIMSAFMADPNAP